MPPAKAASRRSTRRNVSTQGTQALEDTSTALVEPQSVSHEKSVSSQDAPEPVEMPPPDTIPASATPPRPPVQRLDSLNRPSSSTPTTSTIKPALKYKPKNIRRSKEEREAAELAEAERTRQRLAAAGNATTVSSRGNWPGRGGSRGRGYSGRGVRGGREFVSTASGPFGSGSVPTFEKKRLTIPGLGRSTLSSTAPSSTVKTTPRIKKEPRIRADKDGDVNMDEKKPRVKAEIDETVYISSDDEEEEKKEGPRMDIEQINLVSDDDGEEDRDTSKGKGRAKSIGTSTGGLKPIRIERRPHAERSVAVNTEASSAVSAQLRQQGTGDVEEGDLSLPSGLRPASVKRKGKARSKDIEFIKDERRWRGVWQTNDEGEEVIVKEEPEEAEDVTIMEVEPAALETPMDSSAENAKPLKHMAGDLDVDEKGAHKPKTRRRKKAGLRDEKPILQTEEDRQEWARHQQDIHLLVDELGLMPTAASIASVTTNLDPQGDTTINNTTAPTQEVKDDRLFLFQFPPIIPGLVDMMLKEEPSETNYQSAKAESASAAASSHEAGAGTLAKGSKSASNLKADQKSNLKPVALTADMSYVPKGLAGKLTVHESGRTIISWGGSSLELGRAADSEFLQDVVLVDVTHNGQSQISSGGGLGGDEGAEVQRRNGLGLGSVMGKYVVTPDWMGLV